MAAHFLESTLTTKPDLMLSYMNNLPEGVGLSQLLKAELSYMALQGPDCRLVFEATAEVWYVWDQYWRKSPSLARVREVFQTQLAKLLREAIVKAEQLNNLNENQLQFLRGFETALQNKDQAV